MKRIISKLLIFTFIICYIPIGNIYAKEFIIDEDLQRKIESNETVDILIEVKDSKVVTSSVDLEDDETVIKEDRKAFVEELEENADASQKDIIDFLEEQKKLGKVEEYESFHIINIVNVVCKGEVVNEILKVNNVLGIEENKTVELSDFEISKAELSGSTDWNLVNTKVNEVHQMGNKGDGIVIGVLDSGAFYKHSDIANNWFGKEIGSKYGWFDALGKSSEPIDVSSKGHGTSVIDIAVGEDTGVAPEAKWMAARAFEDREASFAAVTRAAQWFLAPGGRTDYAPDIVNNSWGVQEGQTKWLNNIIDAWIKAGIIPIFASGNSERASTKPGTIDYPATNLKVISVGAVDINNEIYRNSQIGPSPVDSTKSIIKPELTAPGVSIVAANNNNGYYGWTGTSMATPNVSGIVALMLNVNKDLTLPQIKEILTTSAKPIKDVSSKKVPNMVYGYGIPNAKNAVDIATNYQNYSNIKRLSGNNRYLTSLSIANEFYTKADVVYITNGGVYADGLSMGSLTKNENGPLLLSRQNSISEELDKTIRQLSPKKIVIIGGEGTIDKNVEKQLGKYNAVVERVSGKNRFETAIKIAEKTNNKEEAFLVNGYIEADSINIVSASSNKGIPVLFTRDSALSEESLNYIVKNNITKITIVGGPGTVKDSVITELESIGVTDVERISGSNRYETGIEVNKKYYKDSNEIFFANGINIADALAVGPAAGRIGAQIQIIPTDFIHQSVTDYYLGKNMNSIYILGGEGSVNYVNKHNIYKIFY